MSAEYRAEVYSLGTRGNIAMRFICPKCHRSYPSSDLRWRCDCGGFLMTDHVAEITRADIKADRFNMWRYDAAYPMSYEELAVTFDEGLTPLVKVPVSGCRLRVKMDSLMPTGSFKDRGTVMVINFLLKHGVSKITEDSSGNAGASVAGYCALGNIQCEIYIPKGTSYGKTVQIRSYGANVYEIEGTREDVAAAAQQHNRSYAGHNWHPMFLEGTKSLAYELWEQNGFKAPENIVAVAGNGSTILGIYYGFKDLLRNHQIEKMPRLFAVQAENCNPIYRAYRGITDGKPFSKTVAEGIALAIPNKGLLVVNAARETSGEVLCVSEEKIIDAVKDAAALGLFIEPTSAAAYAGIKELMSRGVFNEQSDVIMIVSGNGLKAGAEIAELYDKK